eukprot:scaffold4157_cov136-Cylindrotheca_fusiformis.AAC.34
MIPSARDQTPAGTDTGFFLRTSVKSFFSSVRPVAHMTLANIQLIRVPLFVHIKEDGFDKPNMADPKTKNGKADVNRDRTESSLPAILVDP